MNEPAWDMEAIVREVLRRLSALAEPRETLVLEHRLVTLASIRGQLTGVRCLRVPARAVVTPAVKDELRERKIVLEREPAQVTK